MRYLFDECVLDTERRELCRGANAVSVAPQVFDLLEYLLRNRERVVTKDELIAAVWGQRIVSDAAVTTRMNVARSAIADRGETQHLIKTFPRKGFRFVGAVREEQSTAIATEIPSVIGLPDKPSIAVLPFNNLSADPEQAYFADGVVEDIITELSRFSELFVIARHSSFKYKDTAVDVRVVGHELGVRYVLEGSVRRTGERLRIGAKLIDAETGTNRWAETYDRALEHVFEVQDEVVRTIVPLLAAHVRKAETERARTKPPTQWQAYDWYLQAAEAFKTFTDWSFNVEEIYKARRLIEQSIAIDPTFARSYALLANTYDMVWVHRLDSDFLNPAALERANQLARKAVELDPNLPEAHAVLGLLFSWAHHHDAAVAEFGRALALNPNYADWRIGWALVPAGDSKRAIEVLSTSMRLDPFHGPLLSFLLGVAQFMLEDYSQAMATMRDYVAQQPMRPWGHTLLAMILAQLGQLEETSAEAAEVLRLDPTFTISGTAKSLVSFKYAKDDEHFFGALRKTGLPV